MSILRVLIADPNNRQRRKSAKALQRFRDVRIVGEARDGLEAYALARMTHPDLIVTEISLPGMNGFNLARLVKHQSPSIRIIILTSHEEDTYRVMSELLDVDGYIRKDSMDDKIPEALRSIERRLPLFVDRYMPTIDQKKKTNVESSAHHLQPQ